MNFRCGSCGQIFRVDAPTPEAVCPRCEHTIDLGSLEQGPEAINLDEALREQGFLEQARAALRHLPKVHVKCGGCGKELDLVPRYAGERIRCPGCAAPIDVPEMPSESFEVPELGEELGEALPPGDAEPADETPPEPVVPDVAAEGVAALENIRVICGNCSKRLSVAPELAGQVGLCPACGKPIRIPYPQVEEDFRLDQLAQEHESVLDLDIAELSRKRFEARTRAAHEPDALEQLGLARWRKPVLWALAGAAALLLAAAVVIFWPAGGTPDEPEAPDAPGDGATAAVVPPTPTLKPETRPEPVKMPPALFVPGIRATLLLGPGYRAAGPESVYWRVRLRLVAGDEPVRFNAWGPGVALEAGGKAYPALGIAPRGGTLPPEPLQRIVGLKPGQKITLDLLFLAPAGLGESTLRIAGLPEYDLDPLRASGDAEPAKLAGAWTEAPPRNLRPMLRNPVMAAIQQAVGNRLITRAGEQAFDVELPEAKVSGRARPLGDGLYAAVLERGDNVLDAKLRLFNGGTELLLYLSDRPFHQLRFERAETSASTAPR